ncbi:MAG: gamma-glutamyl-phosphate reductase, partial [Lachnospiraceae bacterium]|nr:gamma-glutamyl-phosphate reductase [Lachnospiraceae bacterium]
MKTIDMLAAAKEASLAVASYTTEQKNAALEAMAAALEAHTPEILAANKEDMNAAKGTISDVMLDRLMINEDRIAGMAKGIREVVDLPDPVGSVIEETEPQPGLKIQKVSVPMGVIAIIYESR